MTSASLKALLSGIIDYAGLFPPAKLPLEQAIRNYARYRTAPESWMLGRFILPAARLTDLLPFAEELFPEEALLRLSLLGRGGQTPDVFLTGLRADIEDAIRFRGYLGPRASFEGLEVRLPAGVGAETDLIRDASRILAALGQSTPELFLEVGPGGDCQPTQEGVIAAIARFNQAARTAGAGAAARCGFKLRCGGTEAAAVPSPEQVVAAVFACVAGQVPFKATAGLHHPFRRFDSTVGVPTHGFLNLFGMGTLAWTGQLEKAEATQMLTDGDPMSFAFDDAGFRWKDCRATVADVQTARREALISFGSCSFEEPCEDLHALGLVS
jgi:hypothetical protein